MFIINKTFTQQMRWVYLGKRCQGRHFTIDFKCHVGLSTSSLLPYRLIGWHFKCARMTRVPQCVCLKLVSEAI